MASRYGRIEVIKAGQNSSAVGHALFHTACAGRNDVTGREYDYQWARKDRLACGIAFPLALVERLGGEACGETSEWIREAYEADRLADGKQRDGVLGPRGRDSGARRSGWSGSSMRARSSSGSA